ncbi:MAG: bacterial Ig-like domain-containing protein, partial [Clostridia bacterium]|nr:bacterial Ig-like domain-containing protein [Clostridia bacterium]
MKTKTMQRFALLTVVSVLLVAFALFAVACGKTDDPKKPAKTLSSVSVVASETKFTLDENHTTILLTVGDSISFDKADFTVTAIYSDKTTGKVTDFTIDASAVNVSVAGSYSIIVTYKGTTASVGVLVSEKAKTALHISQDDVSFTYDGTEKDFIAAYDEANANGKLSDFLKDGKVTLSTD